jgi:hypothetical protein
MSLSTNMIFKLHMSLKESEIYYPNYHNKIDKTSFDAQCNEVQNFNGGCILSNLSGSSISIEPCCNLQKTLIFKLVSGFCFLKECPYRLYKMFYNIITSWL